MIKAGWIPFQLGLTPEAETPHTRLPPSPGASSGQSLRNLVREAQPTQASQPVAPASPESLGCWHGARPRAPRNWKSDLRAFQ